VCRVHRWGGGAAIDAFFFFPPASSESYCFIIHAMGANRPLAGRRSVAVLTVHGTLRAAGSAPPPKSSQQLEEDPELRFPLCWKGPEPLRQAGGGAGKRLGANLKSSPPLCQPH
jgi:hypothetical protein